MNTQNDNPLPDEEREFDNLSDAVVHVIKKNGAPLTVLQIYEALAECRFKDPPERRSDITVRIHGLRGVKQIGPNLFTVE
jgi:hypothetical protein